MSRLEFINNPIVTTEHSVENLKKSIEAKEELPQLIRADLTVEKSHMLYDGESYLYVITKGIELPSHLQLHSIGYNGYIILPKKLFPGKSGDYVDMINHINCHGGCTYTRMTKHWVVFGFDTAHSWSGKYPVKDVMWIKEEIKKLLLGALAVSKFNKEYLKGLKMNSTDICRKIQAIVCDTNEISKVMVKHK